MVVLGRAMVCFHRLSVQTTVVSGTVWPQFVMQVLGCEPQSRGRGGYRGLELGLVSSPVMTSYRLPIVTIGLSLTMFAVLD